MKRLKNKVQKVGDAQIIELNGKRYNALTGKVIGGNDSIIPKKTPSKPSGGVVLDGFIRRSLSLPKQTASKRRQRSGSNSITANHVHERSQKSKTLKRMGLSKPDIKRPPKDSQDSLRNLFKPNAPQNAARIIRAQNTPKNRLISRFGQNATKNSLANQVDSLPVKAPDTQTKSPIATNLPHSHQATAKSHESSTDPFASILAEATSHKAKKLSKGRLHHRVARKLGMSTKTFSIVTGSLAAILLVAFFAFQNAPNLAMRIASTRAGVPASYPAYSPTGFSYKNISYSPGQVTIQFRSNSDDRNFKVTQQASNWNSEALLNNYIAPSQQRPLTFLDKGKTIYIYDNSNATWVDGGIWYKIEGNAQLTSDQLLRIARSL